MDSLAPGPVLLIGTSLGGAVAIQGAVGNERVAGVIAAEAFSDLRTIAIERAPRFLPRPVIARAFRDAGADIIPSVGAGGGAASLTETVSGGTGTPYAGAGMLSVVLAHPAIAVARARRGAARVRGRDDASGASARSARDVTAIAQNGHATSVVRMWRPHPVHARSLPMGTIHPREHS